MDREKVIKGLEELQTWLKHIQSVGYHGDIPEYRERELTVSDALVLLREQKAVAPVCTEYDRAIVLFSCRDCKTQLLYGQRYCHMCGRKVKWDD